MIWDIGFLYPNFCRTRQIVCKFTIISFDQKWCLMNSLFLTLKWPLDIRLIQWFLAVPWKKNSRKVVSRLRQGPTQSVQQYFEINKALLCSLLIFALPHSISSVLILTMLMLDLPLGVVGKIIETCVVINGLDQAIMMHRTCSEILITIIILEDILTEKSRIR